MSTRPLSKPALKPAQKPKATIYGAIVALVVALGIVAVVVSRNGSDDASSEKEFGTITVTGTALPALTDGAATDEAAGQAAPKLVGTDFEGASESVSPGSGPMVVMFVAHWCPHCQREVPLITSWLKASGLPSDVELRAVATSTDSTLPNFPPSSWLKDAGFPITTLRDDATNTAAMAYGLTAFPYFVALDKDGKVVSRATGELTQSQFEGLITAARTGSIAEG